MSRAVWILILVVRSRFVLRTRESHRADAAVAFLFEYMGIRV